MNNENKKVLSVGWIGQGDFGDEAMAYALRKFLKLNGFGAIAYYQHGEKPAYRSDSDELNISILHKFGNPQWKKNLLDFFFLKRFNILLMGGGSIFHSLNSIKWKHELLKKIKRNKNFLFSACVGVSLGPFTSQEEENACAEFLQDVDLVLTRDKYSADLAERLGKNKNIIRSCDISLALPILCENEFGAAKNAERDMDSVGIMLIREKRNKQFDSSGRFDEYLGIINRVLDKGKKAVLFNLYLGPEYLDIKLNEKLKAGCKHPDRVEIFTYGGDIFETAARIRSCGHIISMRLHGIIFAYMLGVPFLSLGYNRKNSDFCFDTNYSLGLYSNYYLPASPDVIFNSIDLLLSEGEDQLKKATPADDSSKITLSNLLLLKNELLERSAKA